MIFKKFGDGDIRTGDIVRKVFGDKTPLEVIYRGQYSTAFVDVRLMCSTGAGHDEYVGDLELYPPEELEQWKLDHQLPDDTPLFESLHDTVEIFTFRTSALYSDKGRHGI